MTSKKLNARLLSLALSVVMVCAMVPGAVFAAEGGAPLGTSPVADSGGADTEVDSGNPPLALAPKAAGAITVTIGGNKTGTGATLAAAIANSYVDVPDVTTLTITAGTVTKADWEYLTNLSAMNTFEIASGVTVAPIPDSASITPIFPKSIVTVTVPQAITIGICAFRGCTALTSVSLPEATKINDQAFYGCTALTSVDFPKATNTGKQAFYECTALTSVSFPVATSIDQSSFSQCGALTSASFPMAETIVQQAFVDCNTLTTVSFPKVTSIGDQAFANCDALATLKLCATPPTVGNNAFKACPSRLALGYVDAEGNDLAGGALADAITAYKTVADADDASKWHGWTIEAPKISLTATIGGVETTLSGDSLELALKDKDLTKVTSLKITAGTVTGMEKGDDNDWNYLKNLEAMTTFEIASAVTAKDMPDGTTDAPIFPASIVTVTVPQAITIGECAFAGCTALTTVGFPAATGIGDGAFLACTSLTSASFPAAKSIGYQTFYNCAALTTASFPAVESITMSAFSDCSALATLKLGATPPSVEDKAFKGCPDIRALGYVGADGKALTGGALAAAVTAYKTAASGADKWNGWTIEPAPVASIGDTTYLALQAALDAIEDGQTIKILADITEAGVKSEIPFDEEVDSRYTIDLNGFDVTLTGTNENRDGLSVTNSNSGKERLLTLTDNSSGEAGTFTANGYRGTSGASSSGISTENLTVSRVTLVANGGGPKNSAGIYLTAAGAVCTIEDGAVVTAKTEKTIRDSWGIFSAGGKIIVDDAVLYAISPADAYSEGYKCATCVQPEDAQGNKLNPNEDPTNPDGWKRLVATYGEVAPAITVTINGAEHEGATLQDAITKSGIGAAAVTSLKVTAGTVTEDDWHYLKSLKALTSFEIDSAVTDVQDMPDGEITASIFPASIVTVTVPQTTTIGMYAFNSCSALTSISFPAVTNIGPNSFVRCTALTSASFPKVTNIDVDAFWGCTTLATLKLPATPPAVGNTSVFDNCPAARSLGYVAANGTALTGDALATAIANYKAAAGTDGKWNGWTIDAPPKPTPSGGGDPAPAPVGNIITNPVGTKTAPPALTEAVRNAFTSGSATATARVTFQNFDALAPDGVKAILDAAQKAAAGTNVKLSVLTNFDKMWGNTVASRITLDPAKLSALMGQSNVPLQVWFNQTGDEAVRTLNSTLAKSYQNKFVSVVYAQQKPYNLDAEFCARLGLENTFGKDANLYFYSHNSATNQFTRVWNPGYWVDESGFAHITAPFGGNIIITDEPLAKK